MIMTTIEEGGSSSSIGVGAGGVAGCSHTFFPNLEYNYCVFRLFLHSNYKFFTRYKIVTKRLQKVYFYREKNGCKWGFMGLYGGEKR